MSPMTVLLVGLSLPTTLKKRWESRGLFVTFCASPEEAGTLLRFGDFDLCLLGTSLSGESIAKLVFLLRHTLRSTIPILSLTDLTGHSQTLKSFTLLSCPDGLPNGTGELLSELKQAASFAAAAA